MLIAVSVIVPVYNMERYLSRCLDSLLAQTLQELDILVVDDGSTDRSQSIIREYSAKSAKIRLLVKENGGLSDARNFALPYAQGEYVGYVDSDDFVEPDMYETMYRKAKDNDSDIVECNLRHTYPDKEDVEIGEELYDKKQLLMLGRSVVWNKLYKREWLLQCDAVFPKGYIYEDVEFFSRLVPHIRVYSYVKPAFVHYVQRAGSFNHLSSSRTLDILGVLEHITLYYKDNHFYEEYRDALEFLFARILLCSSFYRICRIAERQERKHALRENWQYLMRTFPDWRRNAFLRSSHTRNVWFMRSMTPFTYGIFGEVLSFVIRWRIRNSKGNLAE